MARSHRSARRYDDAADRHTGAGPVQAVGRFGDLGSGVDLHPEELLEILGLGWLRRELFERGDVLQHVECADRMPEGVGQRGGDTAQLAFGALAIGVGELDRLGAAGL
jgi:hypothetical protein